MTTEVEKEVNDMCNLGEGIYENGLSAGIAEGTVKGKIEGREDFRKAFYDLRAEALKNGELSLDEINEEIYEVRLRHQEEKAL